MTSVHEQLPPETSTVVRLTHEARQIKIVTKNIEVPQWMIERLDRLINTPKRSTRIKEPTP